jgi:predicted LPLAT superfamily acyltransferase
VTPTSSDAPTVKMKAPKGAVVFGDPFGTVDSARAVADRRGGELHTTARVSTIVDQNSL